MNYLKYDNYFDTSIEYIQRIPKTWKLTRNKNLFVKYKNIAGSIWNKYSVLSLTKEGVIIKDIEKNEGKMPSDFGTYQIVEKGNLLLCLFDIDVTPRCVGYIDNKGITSPAYTQIAPISKVNMKYYNYWYLMLDNTKELLHLSKNLRNSLSTENFMELYIAEPPLNEQKQIAKYLDKKTTTIQKTITKNKKLITLLKEKRTTLINQTVTKGLNPETPMKESGIKWIGKIPKTWDCRKISTLSNIKRGASPRPIDDPIYFDEKGEYSWVRISNVTSSKKYLIKTDQRLSKLGKSLSAPLEPGNIFVSIAATVGKPIITKIKCCVHDGFVYFENLNLNCEYLYYIFESGEPYKGLGKEGTQLNLNRETIGTIYIPYPNNEEQKQIVEYLDKETQKIDETIEKIERNIELLEEYKESLIHHVVTGKIDVRGVEV